MSVSFVISFVFRRTSTLLSKPLCVSTIPQQDLFHVPYHDCGDWSFVVLFVFFLSLWLLVWYRLPGSWTYLKRSFLCILTFVQVFVNQLWWSILFLPLGFLWAYGTVRLTLFIMVFHLYIYFLFTTTPKGLSPLESVLTILIRPYMWCP